MLFGICILAMKPFLRRMKNNDKNRAQDRITKHAKSYKSRSKDSYKQSFSEFP